MAKYKLLKTSTYHDNADAVETIAGTYKKVIPFVNDNTDYQEYLEWVAAGNTADAAD